MLKNFVKVADMPQEVIEKYKDQVPAELVQIWQEDGLGTFLDGYLKVINPDDYLELLQDSYFRGDVAFPMFVTAFGDVITWEENAYVGIVQYNIQDLDIICKGLDLFIQFLDNEYITKKLGVPVYFTDPYSSWQKGSIENQNGLIRQYIPKSSTFENISHQFVSKVADKINRRPREKLNFRTPLECFYENIL